MLVKSKPDLRGALLSCGALQAAIRIMHANHAVLELIGFIEGLFIEAQI
jgi:hypothetical protein